MSITTIIALVTWDFIVEIIDFDVGACTEF